MRTATPNFGTTHTYDRDSNVTAKVNTNQTANNETYTYDTLAQLTAVSRGGGAYQSFGVDSLGNIGSVTTGGTEQDRTSNSENQLTAVGSTALAYDANGNLTTDDQGRTLVYDAWNRLLAVMDGGVIVVSYGYDGLGRLITETDASGTRTDTYFSGTQDIETRVDGAVAAENVFSPVYVNAILLRDAGSERVYFTADANYNVTGVVGTSGTMLQRQVYDAYGNVTFTDASWNPLTADGQGLTHLYQGMLYAPEIGWYYSGQSNFARWYSPGLMIWTRGDQGYIDSMDLYEPFAANPINFVDWSGLAATSPAMSEKLDRGEFTVSMNTSQEDTLSSNATISFTPNDKAKAQCTEIRLIQLAASVEGGVQSAVPPDSAWHIDDGSRAGGPPQYYHGIKPYYLLQYPWDPTTKGVTKIFASLDDNPGGKVAQQAWETVAVAVSGPEKGTVYGAVYWGHFMTKDLKDQQRWVNNAGPIWWTYNKGVWNSVGALGAVSGKDYEIKQNAKINLQHIAPGHASKNFLRLIVAAGLLP